MDAGIHAAILGGALGGLTAGWAVGRAQRLAGRYEAQAKLEAAADGLRAATEDAFHHLAGESRGSAQMEALEELDERIEAALRLVARYARSVGLRRGSAIDRASDDLFGVWMALIRRWGDEGAVTLDERFALSKASHHVYAAVYGKREFARRSGPNPRHMRWARYGPSPDEVVAPESTWRALARYRWTWWRRDRLRRREPYGAGRQLAREVHSGAS